MSQPQTPTPAQLETLWLLLADLATATGAAPLNKHPACWYIAINHQWEIAINGHHTPQTCRQFRQRDGIPATVEPFHLYGEFNGWPAIVANPAAAEVAAGNVANLANLTDAIRTKLIETTHKGA